MKAKTAWWTVAGVATAIGAILISNQPADVDWSMYSPHVKERIDNAARTGDCDQLYTEFENSLNNGSSRNHYNVDLTQYIEDKAKEAGCP